MGSINENLTSELKDNQVDERFGPAWIREAPLFYAVAPGNFHIMSANETMAELPKLKREDLERIDARLHQLLDRAFPQEKAGGKAIGQVMLEFAGRAERLPEDYSVNIDHYLYGVPKRQS